VWPRRIRIRANGGDFSAQAWKPVLDASYVAAELAKTLHVTGVFYDGEDATRRALETWNKYAEENRLEVYHDR